MHSGSKCNKNKLQDLTLMQYDLKSDLNEMDECMKDLSVK